MYLSKHDWERLKKEALNQLRAAAAYINKKMGAYGVGVEVLLRNAFDGEGDSVENISFTIATPSETLVFTIQFNILERSVKVLVDQPNRFAFQLPSTESTFGVHMPLPDGYELHVHGRSINGPLLAFIALTIYDNNDKTTAVYTFHLGAPL